jgi:AraC-like DNA-binding protein
VFEIGPRDGDVYETLRDNISGAIQGALLFQEIQQARLTAEKADQIKTRLLSNVSHELRAPLNIILGYTQNILQGDLAPTLRSEIQHIQNNARHQLRVTNDLLDLSRAEIDELDLTFELIDPHPLLHEAFQSIAGQDSSASLEWKLDLPQRLPVIRADAVRLRQILLNLLSNARKFTETGQITLGAEVSPPYVHFWVSDTGWGISPDQQERIFEPFVTMERDSHNTGGIGLGLSITRHLVTLQGGRMTLDSAPGSGSTFHFYLPLPVLEQDQAVIENTQPVLLLLSSAGNPAPEILAICERQHLKLCILHSLNELESVLANTRPQAVAWDLTASRPGDWNLVRRLRPHPALSQAPFILYGHQPESETDLAVGLTGFVEKAPDQQTLLETILALCPTHPQNAILIVDDDPQVRGAHQAIIEQGLPECSIRLAESGETALRMMADEIPSLVLLDLIMPGITGADVLDQMRADPRLRQVPVIILSNKLLTLEDVKRIEQHTRVTIQSKGVWSETEMVSMLNRALFGSEMLPPHTSALVKRAVVYLQQNYSRPFSRWELAEAVGISEDYLTRVFSRELEISPWDYLNRYRILQAQNLLKTTTHSIGVIAHQVGFSDQAYFARVFSKQAGISPQAYRDTQA